MSLHTRLYRRVTDPHLRLATVVALVSVPVTVALSWGTVTDELIVVGGTVSGVACVVAGLFVGYLYYERPTSRRRAGIRAGVVASTGLVVVYVANMLSTLETASPGATAVTLVGTVIAIVLGVGLVVLVVSLAVFVGDRLAAVRSWRGEVSDETGVHQTASPGTRWWPVVVGYACLVPLTAGYLFGVDPSSTVGGLLAAILVLVTTVTASLALVAVYKDAERLYEAGSPWVPNVVAYVGVPVVAFVLGYYVATLNGWEAPAAVGQYSFLGVCWFVALVYLIDRRRSVGTLR